jgi:hypothetical protein
MENFHAVLAARGRSPEIPEENDVYGWLVGSWKLDVCHWWGTDVTARGMTGEAHFGWVLEGRAIQDVWMVPGPAERSASLDPSMSMYGTTLRIWEPALEAWRILWIHPVNGHRTEQVGRRIGPDIVQTGSRGGDGTLTRWRFTEITADSFHWTGEALNPDGQTWRIEGEFRAQRLR